MKNSIIAIESPEAEVDDVDFVDDLEEMHDVVERFRRNEQQAAQPSGRAEGSIYLVLKIGQREARDKFAQGLHAWDQKPVSVPNWNTMKHLLLVSIYHPAPQTVACGRLHDIKVPGY